MDNDLAEFYQSWSEKSPDMICYDNESAIRKVEVMLDGMPEIFNLQIKRVVDFGCGYGKALEYLSAKIGADKGYGFDFSEVAIRSATKNHANEKTTFFHFSSLDINENLDLIKSSIGNKVDAILLIDLLEHIPDCVVLLEKLSEVTKYFIVKLPIEDNVVNNYILKKHYPSTTHDNGHLREFTSNSVFTFIRKIGLTPKYEGIHIYDFRDSYPPLFEKLSLIRLFRRNIVKILRIILAKVVPVKIYIRLFGPGSYYCIATFNNNHVLRP